MKELISELGFKDVIKIVAILAGATILINSHYFISIVSTYINQKESEKYTISVKAKIINHSIKETKYETHLGSKLSKKGYTIDLSYTLDAIDYEINIDILYSNNKNRIKIINDLLNNKSLDSIWLLVDPEYKHHAILNLKESNE